MRTLSLFCQLRSATTFARGDGVAGLVDLEVEHDETGLPYVGGRAVKGLLAEECANILFSLKEMGRLAAWQKTAFTLFGSPGSTHDEGGLLRVGDARPPAALRTAVAYELAQPRPRLTREHVLDSLTAIRRQTSMTRDGAPQLHSLRDMRVVLPGLILESELGYRGGDGVEDRRRLALLAACVAAWRRGGAARNRGRGRLVAWLEEGGHDVTRAWFEQFAGEVVR